MIIRNLPPSKPGEKFFIEFDFAKWLDSTTIVSAVVTVLDSNGNTVTSTLTDSTKQSNTDTTVSAFKQNGTDGETYEFCCTVTDSDGQVLGPLSIMLPVQESAEQALPSGTMYCAIADITRRIGETTLTQLTDDIGAGGIDEQITANAIIAASATIDAYCQKYYTVPISPVPAKIAGLCVDITVYDLYSRSDLAMPEIRKERKDAAIRFLEKVSEGKIDLGVSTPAPADTNNSVELTNNERIFDRSKMSGF